MQDNFHMTFLHKGLVNAFDC